MSTWLTILWMSCQSLDIGTTAVILHQPGGMEGNPLLRGPSGYSVKIGMNVGVWLALRQIRREHSTSRATTIMPIAMAAQGCLAGGLNAHAIATH